MQEKIQKYIQIFLVLIPHTICEALWGAVGLGRPTGRRDKNTSLKTHNTKRQLYNFDHKLC